MTWGDLWADLAAPIIGFVGIVLAGEVALSFLRSGVDTFDEGGADRD